MTDQMRGLTLVETLVAVGVLGVLALFLVRPLARARDEAVLTAGVERVWTTLSDARTRTLGSRDDTAYGVHVASGSVTLFEGSIFSASDPANEEYPLSSRLAAVPSLAGGGDDVVFERLTGETAHYGTIEISLNNDALPARTVTIHASGIVEK